MKKWIKSMQHTGIFPKQKHKQTNHIEAIFLISFFWLVHTNKRIPKEKTYPGRPPDSIWLANVTSFDHTSNCHFCRPITPQSTEPECIPILYKWNAEIRNHLHQKTKTNLMFKSTPVFCRTRLQWGRKGKWKKKKR